MPRIWTPEQRAAFGEKMAAKRAAAKASKANGNTEPVANPIATDVLLPSVKSTRKAKPVQPHVTISPATHTYAIKELISEITTLPLEEISYLDCGLLLNALNVCSTAVALARRQKQESLEAGTHRMPCKTCGRMIDISKAGGFQILTERDQFHMPQNSYYCSQNCLLARNMPSHARSTSREKKENQA